MKKIILIKLLSLFILNCFSQEKVLDEKILKCDNQPNAIALSPDCNIIIYGGDGKKVRVLEINSEKEIACIKVKDVFIINDIQFAPDGKSFAVLGDNYFIIYNAKTYEEIQVIKCLNTETFNSISYSPDSKRIIGAYNNKYKIWDLNNLESKVIAAGYLEINKVSWAPTGNLIAVADNGHTIYIWDITGDKKMISKLNQKEMISGLSFNKYGNLLISCSLIGKINIYDIKKSENIKQIEFPSHYPRFVTFNNFSESFISGGEDGRLISWDIFNYKPTVLINEEKARLLSYSMSWKQNVIAVGLSDKTIHVIGKINDPVPLIKEIVSKKIHIWQLQGKFEKSLDYLKRVNDSKRLKQVELFTQQTIDSLGQTEKDWTICSTDYDPDNESFKVNFCFYPSIVIKVPSAEAESFDKYVKSLEITNQKFTLQDDAYLLIHLEVINFNNLKSYIYDRSDVTPFNPARLNLEFDPINVDLSKSENSYPKSTQPSVTSEFIISDIDQNLPEETKKYTNAYALIIGNEDYTKYNSNLTPEANVPFAINDAKSFKRYASKVLGIPDDNIVYLPDAIGSVMKREIEKICKIASYSEGKLDLFFYYAGHGLPDEDTKEPYILPVDISTENLHEGIKLSDLYRKFLNSKTHRTIIILDACFSGEGRNQSLMAARSVKIKPQEVTLEGNILLITAVQADQRSLPYNQQKHGIFTYFFLKYLKESNGNATFGDIESYLMQKVPITSLKLFGIEQTPQFSPGLGIDLKWKKWTMKKID